MLPTEVAALSPWLEPTTGRWFVAHTRSRNEKALSQELGRLKIVHYLPLMSRVTRSRGTGRVSRSEVPVFPGYLFFSATEEQRYLTLRTNRVAKVLEVPNQDQLLAELRHLHTLLATAAPIAVSQQLHVGDWGRIIAGPLAGLEGVITRVSHRFRLSMSVTILGQSVSVEVDSDNVERTEPPVYAS